MERMAANRNRSLARRRGWPVPMAWNDDEIDNPDAQPAGHQPSPDRGVRTASLIEAAEFGACLADLTARFGIQTDSIYSALKRAGRTDLWSQLGPQDKPETRAS